jgi:hypothetical protein
VASALGGWTPEHKRGDIMGRIINELLLLSCMVAFVTGVVIATASIIG